VAFILRVVIDEEDQNNYSSRPAKDCSISSLRGLDLGKVARVIWVSVLQE
jgi:hypothetical protein